MANGSFSSNTGVQCNVRAEWSSTANTANNSSAVSMTAYLDYYAPLHMGARTLTFSCNGQTKTVQTGAINDSASGIRHRQLGTENFTVKHNDNGAKSCYIGISIPLNITYGKKYLGTVTAGGTATLDRIARKSTITVLGNFNVEGEHWLDYQKNFASAYMDLYLWAWKDGTTEDKGMWIGEEGWGGYRGNYASGEHTKFDSKQRADIYKLAMPQTTVGTKLNFRYILQTFTGRGGEYIGEDSRVVQETIQGNIKIKNNGTWKNCVPFVCSDGSWKPCSAAIKNSGAWKDGQI